MKYIRSRESIKYDILLESKFVFDDDFYNIIRNLKESGKSKVSYIANVIGRLGNKDIESPVSYITLGDDNSTVKFINSNTSDSLSKSGKSDDEIFIKSKSSMKLGRLVKKLVSIFQEKYPDLNPIGRSYGSTELRPTDTRSSHYIDDRAIEDFVNSYKSEYDIIYQELSFNIIKGGDISKSYDCRNYWDRGKGTLGSSCMNINKGSAEIFWFQLYENNENISLLTLNSPDGKIMGRSLLWNLSNGETFMDRIYVARDSDFNTFIKYAKENKFLYKSSQNSISKQPLYSPKDGYDKPESIKMEVKVNPNINKEIKYFPYLDTMKYFYWETGYLRNYPTPNEYYIGLEDDQNGYICLRCDNTGFNTFKITRPLCSKCGGYEIK